MSEFVDQTTFPMYKYAECTNHFLFLSKTYWIDIAYECPE